MEYETLLNLKAALGIDGSDTTRDTLLSKALAAASRAIDARCGRRFYLDPAASPRIYNPASRVAVNAAGEQALIVDDIGDTAGLVVQTGSGASFTAVTNYEPEPDNALARGMAITRLRLTLGGSWVTGSWFTGGTGVRVRVTARWGWPAVPDEVVEATRIQASRLFRRKDSPEGVLGNAEWGTVRLSRIDPDVEALIQHLVLPGFA